MTAVRSQLRKDDTARFGMAVKRRGGVAARLDGMTAIKGAALIPSIHTNSFRNDESY